MNPYIRALASRGYWRQLASIKFAKGVVAALLASFGALWLAVQVGSFFSDRAAQFLKAQWIPFFVIGIAWALWNNRPRHRISCRMHGRDVAICIRVGDMFDMTGVFVIPSNTSFDTDLNSGLISDKSVQGQFTKRFYDSVAHLDTDLTNALSSLTPERVDSTKQGKSQIYPVGTAVRVSTRGRTAFLVAIGMLNQYGVARATFDDVQNSLPRLWESIATQGTFEPILIPVIGSGFSRLTQTREEIIREIIQSFIAASASQRPTESLTIVMRPKDFYENEVDLTELTRYLQHVCQYTEYRVAAATGTGNPVPP